MRMIGMICALASTAAFADATDVVADAPAPAAGAAPLAEPEPAPTPAPPIIRAPEPEDEGGVLGERVNERLRRGRRIRPERRVEAPNYKGGFSLFDAETLDREEIGFALSFGWPYLSARLQFAVADRLDVGGAFNSVYGQANTGELFFKYRIKESPEGDFGYALRVHADYTNFRDPSSRTRWTDLQGVRDFSFTPGLVVSTKSSSGNSYFVDVGAQVTFDLEPQGTGPLTGKLPPLTLGLNVPIHLGAEWSLSRHANFFGVLGVDILLRQEDESAGFFLQLGIDFMG